MRPRKILASAILLIFFALFFIVLTGDVLLNEYSGSLSFLSNWRPTAGGALGIFGLLSAIGLIRMRRWAHIGSIIFAVIILILQIAELTQRTVPTLYVFLILNCLVIYYLGKPKTWRLFSRTAV